MVCHRCQTEAFKFGFNPQGLQRYRCRQCRKTFSDIPARPLPDMRIDRDKLCQVVHLLCEGTGIRACERLTGLSRRTVLSIVEQAGAQCARLLDTRLRNVKAEQVEVDELWGFVRCKQAIAAPDTNEGDQFTYLSMERTTKLIINWFVGKRTKENTDIFMHDLKARLANRVQLSTDGLDFYKGRKFCHGAVHRAFGYEVDYGVEIKRYGYEMQNQRRYSAPPCIGVTRIAKLGNPVRNLICTSHAERTNLSVRIFSRRHTRLTLGFSKKFENHKHAIALFVAHFNFCRKHSTHGKTPAMASGLTDHVWTIQELLMS